MFWRLHEMQLGEDLTASSGRQKVESWSTAIRKVSGRHHRIGLGKGLAPAADQVAVLLAKEGLRSATPTTKALRKQHLSRQP